MGLDYITGAKIDELSTKMDRIIQLMEEDLARRYPDLVKKGGK